MPSVLGCGKHISICGDDVREAGLIPANRQAGLEYGNKIRSEALVENK